MSQYCCLAIAFFQCSSGDVIRYAIIFDAYGTFHVYRDEIILSQCAGPACRFGWIIIEKHVVQKQFVCSATSLLSDTPCNLRAFEIRPCHSSDKAANRRTSSSNGYSSFLVFGEAGQSSSFSVCQVIQSNKTPEKRKKTWQVFGACPKAFSRPKTKTIERNCTQSRPPAFSAGHSTDGPGHANLG